MKVIQNLSLILTAALLTACVTNPEPVPSQPSIASSCVSEKAEKLVGKTGLSEEVIKEKTKANIVRMVVPNQPVTLDYRADRVTVVVDPQTKIIVQASCG